MKYVKTWFVGDQKQCDNDEAAYLLEVGDDGWMTREIALDLAGNPIDCRVQFGVFDSGPFEMPEDQVQAISKNEFDEAWSLNERVSEQRRRKIGNHRLRSLERMALPLMLALTGALCVAIGSIASWPVGAMAGALCMCSAVALGLARMWVDK